MRKWLKSIKRRYRNRRNLRLGLKSRDPFVIQRELVRHEDAIIFDVGAQFGQTAARYRELFPQARIFSFEPFPESFVILSAAAGRLEPIEVHALALSSASGEARFSVNRNSATNSLLASDASGEVYWRRDTPRTTGSLTVKTARLDDFAREKGISTIDILKLDVQGGEYDVLQGASELLSRQTIGLVYMELITAPTYLGQHRVRDYLEVFDANGYEIFDFFNLGHGGGRLLQMDILVVNRETLDAHERRLAAGTARDDG